MSSLRDLSRRAVLARALATVAVASACGPAAPVPETVAPLGDEPAMAQEVPFEQGPGEALPPDDVGCDEGMTYDDESAGYDEGEDLVMIGNHTCYPGRRTPPVTECDGRA